jgi:hypothetical protein
MMNRIVLGDKTISTNDDQLLLFDEGSKRVGLIVDRRNDLGQVMWLRLLGGRFDTAEEAHAVGMRWRNWFSVAFAKADIAADFDSHPLPLRNSDDMAETPLAPGLVVYPDKPGLTGRVLTWAEAIDPAPLDRLISEGLPPVRESIPSGLERRVELAYSLAHLAMANTNADTEFILWITTVEALIPDEKPDRSDPEVVEYLNQLAQQVRDDKAKYNSKVRSRVAGLVELATQETITELGKTLARNLAGEYDGMQPHKFFVKCYTDRNNLVHGNTQEGKHPSAKEIRRILPEVKRFVMDFLDVELSN